MEASPTTTLDNRPSAPPLSPLLSTGISELMRSRIRFPLNFRPT
ncbi:Uncharacterised protein [Mycobacteroides abscessus subsp. abscessus]|nr:Uncharacterised protein [Mycobacteroides abscessus subsp. abscessus]SKU46380.1 Uncharacterised protein [Mycobacteroides abscessus subsp. abscessus]